MSPIRIATRRSPLALAQTRQVASHITTATGREVELVEVTSLGDQTQASLKDFGGVGVFIAAVRE
ncbi:MAG: hydroxymethylbilane synthase, partial [Planctomycetes bacterium]|nr:hydroxymethylbilane synthase [Planctomycetota bacterium]